MELIAQEERQRHHMIIHNLMLLNTSLAGVVMKLAEMTDTPFELLFPEYCETEKGVEK